MRGSPGSRFRPPDAGSCGFTFILVISVSFGLATPNASLLLFVLLNFLLNFLALEFGVYCVARSDELWLHLG